MEMNVPVSVYDVCQNTFVYIYSIQKALGFMCINVYVI